MDISNISEGSPRQEFREDKYEGLIRKEAFNALKEDPLLWAEERKDAAKFIQGQDTTRCTLCDSNAVSYQCFVRSDDVSILRADLRNKKRKLKKLYGACTECCNCFSCIDRVVEHVFGDPHMTWETQPDTNGYCMFKGVGNGRTDEEDELSLENEDVGVVLEDEDVVLY